MVKDSNPKQLALSAQLSERRARGTKPCRDDSLQFTGRLFQFSFSVERASKYERSSSVASQEVHSIKLALTKGFPLICEIVCMGTLPQYTETASSLISRKRDKHLSHKYFSTPPSAVQRLARRHIHTETTMTKSNYKGNKARM